MSLTIKDLKTLLDENGIEYRGKRIKQDFLDLIAEHSIPMPITIKRNNNTTNNKRTKDNERLETIRSLLKRNPNNTNLSSIDPCFGQPWKKQKFEKEVEALIQEAIQQRKMRRRQEEQSDRYSAIKHRLEHGWNPQADDLDPYGIHTKWIHKEQEAEAKKLIAFYTEQKKVQSKSIARKPEAQTDRLQIIKYRLEHNWNPRNPDLDPYGKNTEWINKNEQQQAEELIRKYL